MIAPSVDFTSALGALTNLANLAGRLRPGGDTFEQAGVDQAAIVDASSVEQPGEALSADQERRARIALQRLDVFMRTSRKKAFNFAKRFFPKSLDDCDDVVQEAARKVIEKGYLYDPSRPFETWYFQVLTNTALDKRRSALRAPLILSMSEPVVERMIEDEAGGDVEEDAFHHMEAHDISRHVDRALQKLSPADADLLEAIHVHELRDSIAQSAGVSVNVLRERQRTAEANFREVYQAELVA